MMRYATTTTASAPNKNRKSVQNKTNADGTHTGGPSAIRHADAWNVPRRRECPRGYKLLISGVIMRIDEPTPTGDETDVECPDDSTESSDDDSDENTESLYQEPMVHKLRYQTEVFFDIKDGLPTTAVEALPLCPNKNSQEIFNGDIIKVRDLNRPPEQRRQGRPGRVTYAISGKHLLQPSLGLRNAVNCKVNVSAIQARTADSHQSGGVTISPGMLVRVEGSRRWFLIQSIVAHPTGDSRYVDSDLIIILM